MDGASAARVADALDRVVRPLSLAASGRLALHASGVAAGPGLVLCGPSGVGKSTVAAGLAARGHAVWADDVVVFEPVAVNAAVKAVSLPFELRPRPWQTRVEKDAPVFPGVRFPAEPEKDAAFFPGGFFSVGLGPEGKDAPVFPAVEVGAVCRLERGQVETPVLRAVRGAAALMEVVPHALTFDPEDPEERRRIAAAALETVAVTPVWRLTFGPGRASFEAVLRLLEEHFLTVSS